MEISNKTTEYLKNTEYDFFIQMSPKEKIMDCSNTLLKLTKLPKKEILHMQGWKFIFDSFDIKTPLYFGGITGSTLQIRMETVTQCKRNARVRCRLFLFTSYPACYKRFLPPIAKPCQKQCLQTIEYVFEMDGQRR